MNQPIVRKTKWFWPWQDEEEENWLEQMSKQGLHLKQAHVLAQYDFVPGLPETYSYRLDFQNSIKHEKKEEYLRLFTDSGWEYLGEMGGWQYFRKLLEPGAEPEIFTDAETKIQKYNRFLTYFGLAYPSYLIVFVALWSSWPEWLMWLNVVVIILASIVSIFVSVKVMERIKQLKTL